MALKENDVKGKGNAKDVPKRSLCKSPPPMIRVYRWTLFKHLFQQVKQYWGTERTKRTFKGMSKDFWEHLQKHAPDKTTLNKRRVSSWRRSMAGTSSHQTAASETWSRWHWSLEAPHTGSVGGNLCSCCGKATALYAHKCPHSGFRRGRLAVRAGTNRPAARIICLLRGCDHLFQVIDRLLTQLESRALYRF